MGTPRLRYGPAARLPLTSAGSARWSRHSRSVGTLIDRRGDGGGGVFGAAGPRRNCAGRPGRRAAACGRRSPIRPERGRAFAGTGCRPASEAARVALAPPSGLSPADRPIVDAGRRAEHMLGSDPVGPRTPERGVLCAIGLAIARSSSSKGHTAGAEQARDPDREVHGDQLREAWPWYSAATATVSRDRPGGDRRVVRQLDLRIASDIYCNTIAACGTSGIFKRAGQWPTRRRWMRTPSVSGYPGSPRPPRQRRCCADRVRGQQEARQLRGAKASRSWMGSFRAVFVGEVRLRIGDLDAPPKHSSGLTKRHDAQPGLAPPAAGPRRDRGGGAFDRPSAAATAGDGGPADRRDRRAAAAQIDIVRDEPQTR